MTILAAALSAVLAASAQAAPSFSKTDVYRHGAATLIVMTVNGEPHPDAVFYAGPKGQWLVTDRELYDLGRDDGWAQIRYDIYNLKTEGLSYEQDSNVLGAEVWRWDSPDSVGALEGVIAKLDGQHGKKEAGLECLADADAWTRRWRSAETTRKSLVTAESLRGGSVRDVRELAGLEQPLADAGAKLDGAKRACDYAIAMLDLDRKAGSLWLSSLDRRKAAAAVAQAENVLKWLPVVQY